MSSERAEARGQILGDCKCMTRKERGGTGGRNELGSLGVEALSHRGESWLEGCWYGWSKEEDVEIRALGA